MFVCFIPGLIKTLRDTDELLEALYTNHRAIWTELGEPQGWRWRSPGLFKIPFKGAGFPFYLMRTPLPPWLSEAPELRDLYTNCRDGVRKWNFRTMPIWIGTTIATVVAIGLMTGFKN
jgi:hypothetical protein